MTLTRRAAISPERRARRVRQRAINTQYLYIKKDKPHNIYTTLKLYTYYNKMKRGYVCVCFA